MARAGGQYRADKNGENKREVRKATQDHPEGNKSRPSEEEKAMAVKPAAAKPADKEVKDGA